MKAFNLNTRVCSKCLSEFQENSIEVHGYSCNEYEHCVNVLYKTDIGLNITCVCCLDDCPYKFENMVLKDSHSFEVLVNEYK